jgi:anti-sigma B factor antagonist
MAEALEFIAHPANSTVATVVLRGHITGGPQAVEFSTHLNKLVAGKVKHVIADLSAITLINSSGLGMLVGGLTTMRKAGGSMRFAAIPENVMNLLEITRLNTVFDISDSAETALKKITSA